MAATKSNAFTVQVKAAQPQVSPDLTKMPPATQIIASDLAVWTFAPSTSADRAPNQIGVFRNGAPKLGSVNFAQVIGGAMYAFDPSPPAGSGSGTGWLKYDGISFVPVAAPV